MSFAKIENGFETYLGTLKEITTKSYEDAKSELSIFTNGKEFQNFIIDELEGDEKLFEEDITDIFSMDVEKGKIQSDESNFMVDILNKAFDSETVVNSLDIDGDGELGKSEIGLFIIGLMEDENVTFENLSEAVTDMENGDFEFQDFLFGDKDKNNNSNDKYKVSDDVSDLLDKAYENKTVKKALDTDGDGKLSKAEKEKFTDYINSTDNNSKELSEDDVKTAVTSIIDGDFSYSEINSEDDNKRSETNTYNNVRVPKFRPSENSEHKPYNIDTSVNSELITRIIDDLK